MPRPFEKLSISQFATRLARHEFERRIGEVHLHHTWRPDHALWRAHHAHGGDAGVIEGMWRYHTEVQGWSDIAQHVSIAPDGAIWTGRSWNRAPASASGHNGNADVIPFMIEMIGDFDVGRDELVDPQREAVLEVIAVVQLAFGLAPEALRLHSAMSAKSCPGDGPSVRWPDIAQAVREKHAAYAARGDVVRATRVPPRRTREARPDDAPTAELDARAMTQADVYRYFGVPRGGESDGERSAGRRGGAARGDPIPPDVLEELRPHVINLTDGRLSTSGGYSTSAGDVRAIFAEHLPRWLRAATDAEEPLRMVLWAHGGLVGERAGLEIARTHVRWWKENGVYPIYFVWETGLLDA
ncbi:MAG TPA: peptidoglycan recognition family protein, partial [Gemmatimonadaceae bacterium]|nr:peptidoglycan recognition family protein [Gemmatimonadaceae bacterium]